MGLTSEQVHWIGGVVLAAGALLVILREAGVLRADVLRYLVGAGLTLVGAAMLLDRFLHGEAAPQDYEAETAQHLIQGGVVLAVGIVELLRAADRLKRRAWALAFPAGVAAVAVMFLLHAQHAAAGPAELLIVQHRLFGATLLVGAVSGALVVIGHERTQAFRMAGAVVALIAALQLLLYSEGGSLNHSRLLPPSTHGAHGGH